MKIIYELTLPGFDAADDSTDHLVLWVAAENDEITKMHLLAEAAKLGCDVCGTVPGDHNSPGVDLVFEIGTQYLAEEVNARVHGEAYLMKHGITAPKEGGDLQAFPSEDGRGVLFILTTNGVKRRVALRHTTLALMVMAAKQLCPGEWQAIDLLDAAGYGLKL